MPFFGGTFFAGDFLGGDFFAGIFFDGDFFLPFFSDDLFCWALFSEARAWSISRNLRVNPTFQSVWTNHIKLLQIVYKCIPGHATWS